jgi:hypothetical protein
VGNVDDEIDRLFRLPPAEFTAARNTLAKEAGSRAAEVKALAKPSLPAWAVNQLHWTEPKIYNAVVESAEDLRATHRAVMSGKRGDLRGAGKSHDDAVEAALKATIEILTRGGHPVTDATRQAIGTTLRALPGTEPPGRFTKPLQPRGFDMLAGIQTAGRAKPAPPPRSFPTPKPINKDAKAEAARAAKAREAAAAATRAVRAAEQEARREEFEAARAARDQEKADRRVEEARRALDKAEEELQDAERGAAAAAKKTAAAQARVEKAEEALGRAKAKAEELEE